MLRVSAKTGQGFDALTALLDQDGAFGRKILDIDYDIYAEGEAELGWLNASASLSARHAVRPRRAAGARDRGPAVGARRASAAEVAHLKVIGLDDGGGFGVANLVSRRPAPELSLPSNGRAQRSGPDRQRPRRRGPGRCWSGRSTASSARCCASAGVGVTFRHDAEPAPGRPTPTHRFVAAVG